MTPENKQKFIDIYRNNLVPPYFGTIREWVEKYVVLPPAYAVPGKLDLSISPYLLAPLEAINDPNIYQVNLGCATQIGKSLIAEICIPYWIVNKPGPIFRIFHNREVSDVFTDTRLIPLLKNCEPIKPLLEFDRFSTKKAGVKLQHMTITCGSSGASLKHGMSVKYLLCDEIHQFEVGDFQKFFARTTAFAGRRKVICSSQPNEAGSEWDSMFHRGTVYEWQWLCPNCNTRQPFHWSKEKPNGRYAGFSWETILNTDGETTDIDKSAKTTYLECECCDHQVHDTPIERRKLNDNGKYICINPGSDSGIVSFKCPNFVNPNLSFAYAASQYMIAKRTKRLTGLDEQMKTFVNQILGNFYHRETEADLSKILTETYDKQINTDKNWTTVMGVDVQRSGKIKYYTVRSFHKNGNESRRLTFGIARTWEEVEDIRKKYNIPLPLVGVDSGDGETVLEVYQQCVSHGQVIKINGNLQYICWTPTKGDGQKSSYKHPDGITKLYAPVSNQDTGFPTGHKLKGIPAPLILFSNYSLKTILAQLRDNKLEGITWKIDHPDEEYDKHMYSEQLLDVIDKKSGLTTKRWIQSRTENHYFDTEVLCLLQAMRANVFSATRINEEDINKIIANKP